MELTKSHRQTLLGLGKRIQDHEITSEELVRECLDQIAAREVDLKAWVDVFADESLQASQRLDAELRRGQRRSPLHGIPVGVKDIFHIKGVATAAGYAPWREKIAPADSTVVRLLRKAGAVILGKTVTTQFASFDPAPTRNPWGADQTPGGSSSGSAAAVASRMCYAAIGSQTGGSITRPASYCGIPGLKPTYGRISLQGVLPLAPSMDHPGPIARCVADLAILMKVLGEFDPSDPRSVRVTSLDSVPNPEQPRVGILEGMFKDEASDEAWSCLECCIGWLENAGARCSRVAIPSGFDHVIDDHYVVMSVEAATVHEEEFAANPDDYLPNITQLIQRGRTYSASRYATARFNQLSLRRECEELFEANDVMICPATVDPAPARTTTGNPMFNSPWSFTGLPTLSIPCALSKSGLPLSVQLIGAPYEEANLLSVAQWCERVIWKEI